ncbi:MAG: hypothetical protein GX488_08145, partial [Clostridiales bacterium]|nr:hypothetical protein [Clostridiales bacterium]
MKKTRKQNSGSNNVNGIKKGIIAAVSVAAVFCAAFAGVGAYANGLDTIYPNVSMDGADIGGMTVAEAADSLIAHNIGTDEDRELKIYLPAGCKLAVSAKDAGCYLSAPDAAVYAFNA